MIVSVEGENADSLRKALKKLRAGPNRVSWNTINKEKNKFLCLVQNPTEEEERELMRYGEIR